MIYKKNKGKIGIIDYQAGNIQSIVNILKYCNQNVEIISTPKKIKKLNKLIFPGVGSFGFLSDFLRKKNFIEEINRFKDKGNLILGICLGMQIFCQNSQESSPNKYGLRWFNLKVKKFNIIGCAGCYPTSILLPLIPLVKNNLIKTDNIIIDSKSGYSGAGRGVHNKYKDKNLYESLSAYGVGFHRHNSEIQQEIDNHTKKKFSFTFTPHLTPMFRGILSTIYLDLNKGVSIIKLENTLKSQYSKNRFVKILKTNSLLSTNDVINTNNCSIVICKTKYKNRVIILSVIDNLIKGGAGQAIQNMNIRYGFNETKGLI